jgi:hypothetical protein
VQNTAHHNANITAAKPHKAAMMITLQQQQHGEPAQHSA